MKYVSLFTSLLCLSLNAYSFDDFSDFEPDLPTVTSASRLSQSVLSSPSAVTVIDSDIIEASGFTDIADLMRLVPGFVVAHAVHGAYAVINHGEGWEYPNRMQIMIDGRSTYTSALSGIAWNALGVQIEDIDRIEVVRGPSASAYGSNSYSGAINIITKAPELDDKFNLRARYGNHGEQSWLLRHSGQVDNYSYRVSLSTRDYEGFDDYRDTRDLQNFSMSNRYKINADNELWADFIYTRGDIERANLSDTEGFFYDSDRDIDAWSTNLKWDHHITNTQQLEVHFFHNYLDENDMALSYPLSDIFGVSPEIFELFTGEPDQQIKAGERSYHTHRTDLEVQYTELFDSGLQYVIGAGTRYDTMKSEALFPLDGTASNTGFRFFGNVQIPTTNYLTINLGGLYELNRTDRPHFSPRASLNFHLNQYQTIRLGYSSAYRIPSLLEENINAGLYFKSGGTIDKLYISDDDLKAEQVRSIDASYLGQLESIPLSWEFRAYREEYNDTIYFYQDHNDDDLLDNELTIIGNAANSTMYGLDGEITYRPEKSSFIRLNFNVGHMRGNLLTDVNREPPLSETQVLSLERHAPKASVGLLVAQEFGTWQVNVGFYHVDNIKWSSAGSSVDRYDRLDASIIKRIKISPKQQLELKLAAQNLNKQEIYEFNDADIPLEFKPHYYSSIALTYF